MAENKDWVREIGDMAWRGPVLLGETQIITPDDYGDEHLALYFYGESTRCRINILHGVKLRPPEKAARFFAELTELIRRYTDGEVQEVEPLPEGLRVDMSELS
jgi:hypothetical protein